MDLRENKKYDGIGLKQIGSLHNLLLLQVVSYFLFMNFSNILSGHVSKVYYLELFEGCLGSSSFDSFLNTYIDTNSPGSTVEAQLRALITNLYAVRIIFQDIAVDTSADDVSTYVRAWSVSFRSYTSNYL